MRMTLVVPVTVTLGGPSALSVLRMISILTYTKGSGQVSVHANKAMQEKNAITASLAIRVTQPVSAVPAVGLAA